MLVAAALLLLGCDAGLRPDEKTSTAPKPPPPPGPTVIVADAAPAAPSEPQIIDWQLAGLGTWKGNIVGGLMWHVRIDLHAGTIAVTDPGGATKQRTLGAERVGDYARLAKAVRDERHSPARNSCTDRNETLQIDALVINDSCPLVDPAAAKLTAALDHELH